MHFLPASYKSTNGYALAKVINGDATEPITKPYKEERWVEGITIHDPIYRAIIDDFIEDCPEFRNDFEITTDSEDNFRWPQNEDSLFVESGSNLDAQITPSPRERDYRFRFWKPLHQFT